MEDSWCLLDSRLFSTCKQTSVNIVVCFTLILNTVTKHCNINCNFFQNSVEGPLEAASCEHSDLVRQLKETDAIAEILGRLYKVDELWGIHKH